MKRRFRPPHPGRIQVFDGETQQLVKTLDATQLADAIRYAPTERGLEPVVRVVTTRAGKTVHVREFGADGRLLRSSTQLAG